MLVKQLVRIHFMGIIVFSENKIAKMLFAVNNRKRIKLVIPDNIVCFFKTCSLRSNNKLFKRSHEFTDRCVKLHTADAVIATGNNAEKFAFFRSVVCNRNRGMSGFFLERNNIFQGCRGGNI